MDTSAYTSERNVNDHVTEQDIHNLMRLFVNYTTNYHEYRLSEELNQATSKSKSFISKRL